MKDKNGIEVCCKNCNDDVAINCPHYNPDNPDDQGCTISREFVPSYDALFARIAELQKELTVIQESERAGAQEADRLREEVQNLKKENERLSQGIINKKDCKDMSKQSTDCKDLDSRIKALGKAFYDLNKNADWIIVNNDGWIHFFQNKPVYDKEKNSWENDNTCWFDACYIPNYDKKPRSFYLKDC